MNGEIKHRMTRRLNGWDYCQRAIYMITITLADRSHEWLGKLILAKKGEAPSAFPAWAEGFQDTILFRDGQLKAMIAYLRDNPRRLAEKRAVPPASWSSTKEQSAVRGHG